jgi:PAS domain S-box-containing protein
MAGNPALARIRTAAGSLRVQATLGFVAFLTLVAAGLSALFLATWESHARAASRQAAMHGAASLADAVALDVSRGDLPRARAALESRLRHDSSLLLASLDSPAGDAVRLDGAGPPALLARLGAGPAPSPDATRVVLVPSPDGPLLDIVIPLAPVADAAADAGAAGWTLRTAYALTPRAAQAAELRWRIIAITLAMLVLGAVGASFLAKGLLGPLPDLVRETERIAEGDLDHQIRVESDDEFGTLARTINQLTGELRRWQDRQHSWSGELSRRVDEKTREIAETREHLANIVENVGASIIVADLDGTVVSANTHTMHIFGMKPEFAVGRRLEEFAGEAGARPDVLLPALLHGGSRVNETHLPVAGDEGGRDLLVIQTLLRDSGGHAAGFLQIAKDVTQIKQMERRLVHSERLSAMGEMAGEIGHELNNYLMAIGGRAELIVAALEGDADPRRLVKIKRGAEIIAEQVGEMRRLTDGLLDASRKESSPTDVDLSELVERTIEFVKPQNRFDGITIEQTLAEGPLRVFADPQQIRQVVLNLLTNAAEATRERTASGGTIRVATVRGATSATIRVSDEGTGIPEHVRDRIFEPHFTTKPKGHGFGLAVCHRVVANHGGVITAESPRAGGAVFTVRLPLPRDPSRAAATSRGTALSPSSPLPFPGIASPSSRSDRR